MATDPASLRIVSNRIASLHDLTNRIALKRFDSRRYGHGALRTAKLGEKASINPVLSDY